MAAISLNSIFSEIESDDFYVNIALINDIDSFLIFLEYDTSINELKNIISIDEANTELLKERIMKLWKFECDSKKLHPYDHAIAIYLYVIFKTFVEKIDTILKFIYKNKLKNLWWTYETYNYIYRNLPEGGTYKKDKSFLRYEINLIDIKELNFRTDSLNNYFID